MNFKMGELVWAKTKNCPLWPCTITKGRTKMDDDNYYYTIKYMGQTSKAIVAQEDIFTFDISRPEFKPSKQVLKKFKTLKKALDQAEKRVNSIHKNSRPKEVLNEIPAQQKKQMSPHETQMKNIQNNLDEQDFEKSISRISYCAQRPKSPDSQLQFYQENLTEKASQIKWSVSPLNIEHNSNKEEHIDFSKELQLSPKKSSFGSKSAKKPFPCFKYNINQNLSKKNLTNKIIDKQQYKVQSLSKIMTHYLVTPHNEQQQCLQQIKFKLQCIVFNLIDITSPQDYNLLKIKFKQLVPKFQIQKMNYKLVINFKINSLLTFIDKKLTQLDDFVEETKWLKVTISQLNNKLLTSINDCSLYQKVELQKSQLFKKPSLKPSMNLSSKQQLVLSKLLTKCIPKIDNKQQQYLTKLIFKSVSQHSAQSSQIWKFIEQNKQFNSSSKFQQQFEAFIGGLTK